MSTAAWHSNDMNPNNSSYNTESENTTTSNNKNIMDASRVSDGEVKSAAGAATSVSESAVGGGAAAPSCNQHLQNNLGIPVQYNNNYSRMHSRHGSPAMGRPPSSASTCSTASYLTASTVHTANGGGNVGVPMMYSSTQQHPPHHPSGGYSRHLSAQNHHHGPPINHNQGPGSLVRPTGRYPLPPRNGAGSGVGSGSAGMGHPLRPMPQRLGATFPTNRHSHSQIPYQNQYRYNVDHPSSYHHHPGGGPQPGPNSMHPHDMPMGHPHYTPEQQQHSHYSEYYDGPSAQQQPQQQQQQIPGGSAKDTSREMQHGEMDTDQDPREEEQGYQNPHQHPHGVPGTQEGTESEPLTRQETLHHPPPPPSAPYHHAHHQGGPPSNIHHGGGYRDQQYPSYHQPHSYGQPPIIHSMRYGSFHHQGAGGISPPPHASVHHFRGGAYDGPTALYPGGGPYGSMQPEHSHPAYMHPHPQGSFQLPNYARRGSLDPSPVTTMDTQSISRSPSPPPQPPSMAQQENNGMGNNERNLNTNPRSKNSVPGALGDRDNNTGSSAPNTKEAGSTGSSSTSNPAGGKSKTEDDDAASILLQLSSVVKKDENAENENPQNLTVPRSASMDEVSAPDLTSEPSADSAEQPPRHYDTEFPCRVPERFPTRLSLPSDNSKLNSLHCFLRSELLEIFVVQKSANKSPTHSPGSSVGRVGLRCVFCAMVRRQREDRDEAPMAVFYPKSVAEIYRLVTSWQRCHLRKCRNLPPDVRSKWQGLRENDKSRGKTQYWVTSANQIGLVDCQSRAGGIRFAQDFDASNLPPESRLVSAEQADDVMDTKESNISSAETQETCPDSNTVVHDSSAAAECAVDDITRDDTALDSQDAPRDPTDVAAGTLEIQDSVVKEAAIPAT